MQGQKSLTPDKPFFIYFAPGATHAPHHVPKEWIAKYKGKFDQGWDKLREETLARQIKLRRGSRGHQARAQAGGDQGLGQAERRREEALRPPDGSVRRLTANTPTTKSAGWSRPSKNLGQLDNTLDLLHRRRQRRERRRGHERAVQRDDLFQRRARNRRRISSSITTNWAVRSRTATTPPAGRWRAIRRSPGRSRSPRITAAPATGWSSTGPRGSRPRARCGRSGITSSTSRRRSSKRPACPSPKSVNGTPQTPIEGVSMVYTFDDAKAKDRHTTQYFEIFGNRAIYHDGWLAGTVHRAAWELKPRDGRSRTTNGSCTTRGRTSAWRTTWPRRTPRSSRRCRSSS